jgi:hypothetical protein
MQLYGSEVTIKEMEDPRNGKIRMGNRQSKMQWHTHSILVFEITGYSPSYSGVKWR